MNDLLIRHIHPSSAQLETSNIQKAIDQLSQLGGGTLIIDPGEYVLGTVFLRSHVHVQISRGARLLGSLNIFDFKPDEPVSYPLYQDASHSYFHCSMFVGERIEDFSLSGEGEIDMRSLWDDTNVRNMAHRAAKIVAIKESNDFEISGLSLYRATDLAVYFAGCKNVHIHHLKMSVYIDGISPDNSENVSIHDCDIVSGDDGIVFKSSFTLNRFGECRNIDVHHCRISSRCNAIKIGTETNGGFYDIKVHDIEIYDTRLCALAIESVDGAIIDGFEFRNVHITNSDGIFYITIDDRLRGPDGIKVGQIKNVLIQDVVAEGPYHDYETIHWNYISMKAGDTHQYLWINDPHGKNDPNMGGYQFTSIVSGLPNNKIEGITFRNVRLVLAGGHEGEVAQFKKIKGSYPEISSHGHPLPVKGIYFDNVAGLTLDNVTVETLSPDDRPNFNI